MAWLLFSSTSQFTPITKLLNQILIQGAQMAADLQARIDKLQADVTALLAGQGTLKTSVAAIAASVTAAGTELDGMAATIAALRAGVTDPAQLAALDALDASVQTASAANADANTAVQAAKTALDTKVTADALPPA